MISIKRLSYCVFWYQLQVIQLFTSKHSICYRIYSKTAVRSYLYNKTPCRSVSICPISIMFIFSNSKRRERDLVLRFEIKKFETRVVLTKLFSIKWSFLLPGMPRGVSCTTSWSGRRLQVQLSWGWRKLFITVPVIWYRSTMKVDCQKTYISFLHILCRKIHKKLIVIVESFWKTSKSINCYGRTLAFD
jgi:hypothetical protein